MVALTFGATPTARSSNNDSLDARSDIAVAETLDRAVRTAITSGRASASAYETPAEKYEIESVAKSL